MNQERIGKFIQTLRREKNLTQEELAKKLGITDRAISKWENGRGLPDYSLIKPLCDALDISINELLNGERIKKEDYQEKFEENIFNTMVYSNKKINHTKFIFKIIIGLIIFLVLSLITMYIIDINRMKNQKPVLFSTWGYDYVPPVNLDSENIELAIKNYFIQEEDANKQHEDEKSFVAINTYLIVEEEKYMIVYALILIQKYYCENSKVMLGSSSLIPYKITLVKEGNNYVVADYQIPRDGSYNAKDMRYLFPNSVREDMNKAYSDGTIEKLELKIKEQVNLYFHK